MLPSCMREAEVTLVHLQRFRRRAMMQGHDVRQSSAGVLLVLVRTWWRDERHKLADWRSSRVPLGVEDQMCDVMRLIQYSERAKLLSQKRAGWLCGGGEE